MINYIDEDIQEVMQITGLDKVKAEKLFVSVAKDLDDGTDDELCSFDIIEVIKTENKVKESGSDRVYVSSDKPKAERKPKERKIDQDKVNLLKSIENCLASSSGITCSWENEVKLHFSYNNSDYSVTLTKHRPPKK